MTSNTEQGRLILIGEIETFESGFSKRQIVIDTGDYPQQVAFELVKDKANLIESYQIGDSMTVHFNLRGNEYKGRHYVNLQAWKLEGVKSADPATQHQYNPPSHQRTIAPSLQVDMQDDIPF